MRGGLGADTFHAGAGHDLVTDFSATSGDRIQVDAGGAYQVTQVGADVHIDLANGGQMTLLRQDLTLLPTGWIISG